MQHNTQFSEDFFNSAMRDFSALGERSQIRLLTSRDVFIESFALDYKGEALFLVGVTLGEEGKFADLDNRFQSNLYKTRASLFYRADSQAQHASLLGELVAHFAQGCDIGA